MPTTLATAHSIRKLAKSFDFPHRSTQNRPENVVELSVYLDGAMCSLCDTPSMRFMNQGEACPRIERHRRSRHVFCRVDFLCPHLSRYFVCFLAHESLFDLPFCRFT